MWQVLSSFIGTDQGKEAFIEEKVQEWWCDLKQLSDIISSREPQIAYSASACMYGQSKRWNYVCRTTPGVADRNKLHMMEQVTCDEQVTRDEFIPAIINRLLSCSDMEDWLSQLWWTWQIEITNSHVKPQNPLRGHTPKQGFVPANPNDFIGRLVTL